MNKIPLIIERIGFSFLAAMLTALTIISGPVKASADDGFVYCSAHRLSRATLGWGDGKQTMTFYFSQIFHVDDVSQGLDDQYQDGFNAYLRANYENTMYGPTCRNYPSEDDIRRALKNDEANARNTNYPKVVVIQTDWTYAPDAQTQ